MTLFLEVFTLSLNLEQAGSQAEGYTQMGIVNMVK